MALWATNSESKMHHDVLRVRWAVRVNHTVTRISALLHTILDPELPVYIHTSGSSKRLLHSY